jgi:hypothetical protein
VLAVNLSVAVLWRFEVRALATWLALATSRLVNINIILIIRVVHPVHALAVASKEFVFATNT